MFGRLDEAEGGEQMTVDIRRLLHSRHSSVVVIEVINVWRFGGGFVGFVIVVFVVLITCVPVTEEVDLELHLGCGGSGRGFVATAGIQILFAARSGFQWPGILTSQQRMGDSCKCVQGVQLPRSGYVWEVGWTLGSIDDFSDVIIAGVVVEGRI